MIIVGSPAPGFTAEAVNGRNVTTIALDDYRGKYVLLFFYPADFSFVCPSELHALERLLPTFRERNVEVLAVSVDSVHTHAAWLETPVSEGGIAGTTFTLVSDINQSISRAYGVLDEKEGVALRGVFVIDDQGVVQYGSLNSMAFGRSIPELLRVVDGIQYASTHAELCPANWQPGDLTVTPTAEGQRSFLDRVLGTKKA